MRRRRRRKMPSLFVTLHWIDFSQFGDLGTILSQGIVCFGHEEIRLLVWIYMDWGYGGDKLWLHSMLNMQAMQEHSIKIND